MRTLDPSLTLRMTNTVRHPDNDVILRAKPEGSSVCALEILHGVYPERQPEAGQPLAETYNVSRRVQNDTDNS